MKTATKRRSAKQLDQLRGPYHEAGHAWQAWRNGTRIFHVTQKNVATAHTVISRLMETGDQDDFLLPEVLLPLGEAAIRWMVAGVSAVIIHDRCPPIIALARSGMADYQTAIRTAQRFEDYEDRSAAGRWVDQIERQVRAEMKQDQNWRCVEAVAQRLLEAGDGVVQGDEVIRLLAAARDSATATAT